MKRPPQPVAVEYTCRNQRKVKVFTDHYAARKFFVAKDRQGKQPKVKKVPP